MKYILSSLFGAILFYVGSAAAAVGLENFAISSNKYDESITLAQIEQMLQTEFGSNYRVATWNDLIAYHNSGNTAVDFEEKFGQGLSVTYNGSRFYSSSSRVYFMSISHRPGQTPHSGYLSHANINNHEFDLGSWYGDKSILVYTNSSRLETTYSWYEGSWGSCTGNCGANNGTKSRTVYCKSSSGGQVSDSNCSGTKPTTSSACTASSCPVGIITVKSPSSSSQITRGNSNTIKWDSSGFSGGVDIQLYQGSSSSATETLVRNTSNDGSYTWTLSKDGIIGNDYKIRVSSNINWSAIYDYSDSFSIVSSTPTVTYSWYEGFWGSCTGDCGTNNGTKTRSVYCKSSVGSWVLDSNCTNQKPATSETCITKSCPISVAPQAPEIFSAMNDLTINVSWEAITDATGYKLYYAPKPYTGSDSIKSIDLENQTVISFKLWYGASYYVAVSAYNEASESGYSNIKSFTISEQVPEPATLKEINKGGMGDFILYEVVGDTDLMSPSQLLAGISLQLGLDVASAIISPTMEGLVTRIIQMKGVIPTFNLFCNQVENDPNTIIPVIWVTPAIKSWMNDLGIIKLDVSAVPTPEYIKDTTGEIIAGLFVPGFEALTSIFDANNAPLSLTTTRTQGYSFLESEKKYILLPRNAHQFKVSGVIVESSVFDQYATIFRLNLEGLRDMATINDSCVKYSDSSPTFSISK